MIGISPLVGKNLVATEREFAGRLGLEIVEIEIKVALLGRSEKGNVATVL